MKLVDMQFPPLPVTSYLLGSNIFLITLFSLCDRPSFLSTQDNKKQRCSSGYFSLYIFGHHSAVIVEGMIIMT